MLLKEKIKMSQNKRNFDEWIEKFKSSISNYSYYVDFESVYKNIKKYKNELDILNSLIGSEDIEDKFESILRKNPKVIKCIPILLAKREDSIFCMDNEGIFEYSFDSLNYTIEQYKVFMRKTGLFELLQKHLVNNIEDYIIGVEVGLNSNGRKNRGGHLMENLVQEYVEKTGVKYYKEMYLSDVQKKWGIDLSAISNVGKTKKRFDFVVKTKDCVYGIEVNFYASNGSKLNETARSYKMLTEEAKNISGFKFVWLTDGKGWMGARHNLEETFDVLDNLYNLNEIENGALENLFK
jgi:type II restriction enzyme